MFTCCCRPDMTASCEKTLACVRSSGRNKRCFSHDLHQSDCFKQKYSTWNSGKNLSYNSPRAHFSHESGGIVFCSFSQQISVKTPLGWISNVSGITHWATWRQQPALISIQVRQPGDYIPLIYARPCPQATCAPEADGRPLCLLSLCLCYVRTWLWRLTWRGTAPRFPLQSQCSVAAHPITQGCLPLVPLFLHSKQMRCHGFARTCAGMRCANVATLLTVHMRIKGPAVVGCSRLPGSTIRACDGCQAASEGVTVPDILQFNGFLSAKHLEWL